MTTRRPLVNVSGDLKELPSGDDLASTISLVSSTTWTSRPTASSYSGKFFFCTDIAGGILLHSDGKVWRPAGGSAVVLASGGCPIGISSSGSMGNNGALTGLTAFNQTYSEGIYLYFGANVIYSGSAAGLYFTVMSSTTAGTIYNNTYTSGIPYAPSSNTAFSSTGPGAFTQTTSEITLLTVPIPGGLLGKNGQCLTELGFDYKNSANAKTFRAKIGGTNFAAPVNYTTTVLMRCAPRFQNINSESFQRLMNTSASPTGGPTYTAANGAWTSGSVNTASDQNLTVTGQLANAGDSLALMFSTIQILPRG